MCEIKSLVLGCAKMSCCGSHEESIRLSGLSSMVSVSHFQITLCFSFPNTLISTFLLDSDISEDFRTDPKDTKITPSFASSMNVRRSSGKGLESLQFIIPMDTKFGATGLNPSAMSGWPKVKVRDTFFSSSSKGFLGSPGKYWSRSDSTLPIIHQSLTTC